MKRLLSIVLVLFLTIGFSLPVCAEPTDAFTHVDTPEGMQSSILSREMYRSTMVLTANSFGLKKSLREMVDFCSDKDGNIYILVSGRSQILILDKDYNYLDLIEEVQDEDGFPLDFSAAETVGAQGIYVDHEGNIYICDTGYNRIIRIEISDHIGYVKECMETPDSALLPDDFHYEPRRITKDEKGYFYILSDGCEEGALSYSPTGKFLGFYGANNVKTNALDTLSFLWDKLTQNDTKKSYSVKSLPSSFVDFCLDSEGYMITCTGKTEEDNNGVGQIRKLAPGGEDILYKRNIDGSSTASGSYNFLENDIKKSGGSRMIQNIVSVDVDENDFIYALDETMHFVYIYDSECNMLGGFGGGADTSKQMGVFADPVSLMVHGENLLVIDKTNQSITVFEPTEYGRLLKEAQTMYIKGNYEDSEDLWKQVLSLNRNCQLAYRGLAMSAYVDGRYEEALDYAKSGLDYNVYDMAHSMILSQKFSQYFFLIFPAFLILTAGLIVLVVVLKKKQIVLIKNIKVKTMLGSTFHPFRAFEEVKYKHYGSLKIAVLLCVLFYIAKMLEKTASGFLFLKSSPSSYNMLYTIAGSVGLVLLWSLANWLVACLIDGKGTFKEVLIGTTYALIPYICFTFLSVLLSHILPLSGLAVMNGVGTIVLIYTFFLLAVAMMSIHEYDFFRFLSTTIITVFLMILVVIVLFLVLLLWQQLTGFISSIFTEVFYR